MISFIKPINKTLSGTIILDSSGPGSNGNEGILHIPLRSWIGASTEDCLLSYPGNSLWVKVLSLYGDDSSRFYL